MKFKTGLLLVALLATYAAPAQAAEPMTAIVVQKMHCGGCAKKIAAKLYEVPGVAEVRVDVKAKTLWVAPQAQAALSPRALWEAVEKGADIPVKLEGPSGIFTEKPRA